MALWNGVLVHGPHSWACAVRGRDGELRVASGEKGLRSAGIESPLLRGSHGWERCWPCSRRYIESFRRPSCRSGRARVMQRSPAARSLRKAFGRAGSARLRRRVRRPPGARAGDGLAARNRDRLLPRRRAHLDRELRARRAQAARARALRLASARPRTRGDRGRNVLAGRLAATPRGKSWPGSWRGWAPSPRRPSSTAGRFGTRRARAPTRSPGPATSCSAAFSTAEPTPEQLEVAEAASAACLELETSRRPRPRAPALQICAPLPIAAGNARHELLPLGEGLGPHLAALGLLLGCSVYLVWRTLALMPRVKPTVVEPSRSRR